MVVTSHQRWKAKWILPAIASVLTLVTASQFYMSALSETDLLTSSGKVRQLYQDQYRHYKSTDNRIVIRLETARQHFFFMDERPGYFAGIKENIHKGDSITIGYLTARQALLGTGSQFKIMSIKKSGRTLYSLTEAQQVYQKVAVFTLWMSIGIWLLYFFLIYRFHINYLRISHNNNA